MTAEGDSTAKVAHATAATQAEGGIRPNCPHRLHPSLIPHLNVFTICPPCAVQRHIKTIKSIQSDLSNRGGIFVSRPRFKKDHDHPEWRAHYTVRNRWRQAKIAAYNDVMKFERLAKSPVRTNEWGTLDEAIELWEKESVALAEVPGYTKEMSEDDVKDIVQRMMSQLQGTIHGLLDEDGDSSMSDSSEDDDVGECPFPDSDVDTDSEDDKASASTGPGASPDEDDMEVSAQPEVSEDEMETLMPVQNSTSSELDDTETQGERVRFTDFATVSSDALTFLPSAFPHRTDGFRSTQDALAINPTLLASSTTLSTTPTLIPHRRRTDAYHSRLRSQFKRRSHHYKAGKWVSPVGYVKLNTSLFRVDWDEVHALLAEQEQEIAEERKVHAALKGVAGTWVLMRVLKPALWSLEEALKKDASQHHREGNGA
jgi:hypothetical protein